MEQEKEHNNGSSSEAVPAKANFDLMSNQEMRTELQHLGIRTCESMPKEFLQSLLRFSAELKVTPSNAQTCSMAPVDNDFEAFFVLFVLMNTAPLSWPKHREISNAVTLFA